MAPARSDDDEQTFSERLDDYLANREQPEGTIGLPAVLAALGADLRTANAAALREGFTSLAFKEATVTLDVAVTYTAEASAKVKFWVFTEAGGGLTREHARTQTVTVTVVPGDPARPQDIVGLR